MQRIVLSVEGVDDVVLIRINLIIDIYHLFNEIAELLHLLVEQSIDVNHELSSENFGPFKAGFLIRIAFAFGAVIEAALVPHARGSFGPGRLNRFHHRWLDAIVLL